jgi:ABC-type nitrate/sulfonate/bicarbonate transport system permease component
MEQDRAHDRWSQIIAGVGRDAAAWVAGAVPIVLIIALWHGIAVSGLAPPALLPQPAAVFLRVAEQLRNPLFLENVGITLLRLFSGFAIAVIAGVGLGLAATASRVVAVLLRPLIRVLAPIPKIALYPALILLLGFDHSSKVALVVADATFPILLAAWHGMATVEPKLVWSARAAGASPWRCLLTVVLPAALPSILTGCRVGLVIACIVVFLAEMISSTDGLGNLLVRAARNFQTVDMFVPIIAISALGLMLNLGFNALRARLLAGFPEED